MQPCHDMRPARRRFLGALLGASLLAGGGGTALADGLYEAAKAEGQVTVYIHEPTATAEALIAAFAAKYPDVKVDYFRSDTTQIAQRLETETAAGQIVADVATLTDRRAGMMKPEIFAAYEPAGLADYGAGLQPEHHLWSVYAMSLTSFAWNTDLVAADEAPKTWEDLADPKWHGKVGMQDPLAGGGVTSWIATMYAAWGEEPWTEYMTKLGEQRPIYGKYAQVQDLLGTGEVSVMPAAYPDYIEALKAKGAPVEWGTPSPMVRTAMSVSLVAGAKHPNAGKLFIDFLMSPEGQAVLAEKGRLPALQSAWPPAVAERLAGVELMASADAVEREKFDFFQAKMAEFFGKR